MRSGNSPGSHRQMLIRILIRVTAMKYLLFIFATAFFYVLYAETEKDVVSRMTGDELKACYENKEKTEQRFLIKQNGYIGFIDGCGRVVVKPVYDSALEFSEGLARVEKNGKFGFIDKSGKVVIDFYLDFAWFFHEGSALAEIHGEKEEKFYIDKENKRYPARNVENPTEKLIRFRKHYDYLIFKEYKKHSGNALAFGGLLEQRKKEDYWNTLRFGGYAEQPFYTDYSEQKLSVKSVLNDELLESCKNTKLLENDGNITFVKNGNILKTLKNIGVYSLPVCQDKLADIVWLKKNKNNSFFEYFMQAVRDFFHISEETLFIYNLDGIKIAGYIIRKIEYLDKNSIKVSFYDGREPEFYDLTGKKRDIEEIKEEEEPFGLPGIISDCDFICWKEKRGEKLNNLEERTVYYKTCKDTGYKYMNRRREIYSSKTGKTIISSQSYPNLTNYESFEQGCLTVVETQENTYYLKDDKVFWSGQW